MVDITSLLATTIQGNEPMIYLVALAAVAVALALSFLSRIAFYVLGILGTLGALWTVYNATQTAGGITNSTLIVAGVLLVGGWVIGFVVRGTIKVGAVLTVAFATLLVWLTSWADTFENSGNLNGIPWYYIVVAGIIVAGIVLAIPTILGKAAKGAVHAVTPSHHGDKKEEASSKEMEVRR
jgi:hypothetical protein